MQPPPLSAREESLLPQVTIVTQFTLSISQSINLTFTFNHLAYAFTYSRPIARLDYTGRY